MAEIIIWTNQPRSPVGLTPFGYFDNDPKFQDEAPKLAKHIAHKLGYPIIEIELQDINFYACFEEAIYTYSAEVNRFNIKDNLYSTIGASTDQNLTHKDVKSNLSKVIELAKEYGSEVGSGGRIDWKKGYVETESNVQVYDLDFLWANEHEAGNKIEIKRVYHERNYGLNRLYDPVVGSGFGTSFTLNEFGWSNMQSPVNYLLTPIYGDLLRMQQIEFSDMIRKSAFSFRLINNKLQIFPIPQGVFKLWFEYILVNDRNNLTDPNAQENQYISDFSNVPYNLMQYSNINDPGIQWIYEFTFALVKVMLGGIRGKYSTIPIPDSDVSLDGDTLRNEGLTDKENLLTNLREMLEQSSRKSQLEAKQAEAEYVQQILHGAPMRIYVG